MRTADDPDHPLPVRKTSGAAGADLTLAETVVLLRGEAKKVKTGFKMALPEGTVGLIFERSSFNAKTGCSLTNKVGVIDPDYRGEVLLSIRNTGQFATTLHAGESIAQLVVIEALAPQFEEVESLDETERGEGGFGSTGA